MSTRLARKSFEAVATSFLVVATTRIGAIGAKQTEKCFTNARWVDGADKYNHKFPANQPRTGACVIATLAPSNQWTFAEAAAAILGVNVSIGYERLVELLIKHRKTLTLAQLEKMAESTNATSSDEYANMCVGGYLNFAFVEMKEGYNSVVVAVSVHRLILEFWNTRIHKIDNHVYRSIGHRLMIRNPISKH